MHQVVISGGRVSDGQSIELYDRLLECTKRAGKFLHYCMRVAAATGGGHLYNVCLQRFSAPNQRVELSEVLIV